MASTKQGELLDVEGNHMAIAVNQPEESSPGPSKSDRQHDLLPEIYRPTVVTDNGRTTSPLINQLEQTRRQLTESLLTQSQYEKQIAGIKNDGRPFGFLVTALERYRIDRNASELMNQMNDIARSQMIQTWVMTDDLINSIQEAANDEEVFNRSLRLQRARTEQEQAARKFDMEHSEGAYASQWEIDQIRAQGEVDVEKLKASGTLQEASASADRSHQMAMAFANQFSQIADITRQIELLEATDPNQMTAALLANLYAISDAMAEANGSDEPTRLRGRQRMSELNMPLIIGESLKHAQERRKQVLNPVQTRPIRNNAKKGATE